MTTHTARILLAGGRDATPQEVHTLEADSAELARRRAERWLQANANDDLTTAWDTRPYADRSYPGGVSTTFFGIEGSDRRATIRIEEHPEEEEVAPRISGRTMRIVMRARTIAEEIDLDPEVATILCGRVEEIMDGTVATETAARIADSLDDHGHESLASEIREWFPSDDPREDDPTIYGRSTR